MKNISYYVFFPHITLMRFLYRFIKTEMRMVLAMGFISQVVSIPIRFNLIPLPILIDTVVGLYIQAAILLPLYYFETDVKRRRLNGFIPIEERHR